LSHRSRNRSRKVGQVPVIIKFATPESFPVCSISAGPLSRAVPAAIVGVIAIFFATMASTAVFVECSAQFIVTLELHSPAFSPDPLPIGLEACAEVSGRV
jgi:hypothetical protein